MADKSSDKVSPGWNNHMKETMLDTVETEKSQDPQLPWHSCFVCGESKTKDGQVLMVCGNCGTARYCSKHCQKKAWKQHKVLCNFTEQGKDLQEKAEQTPTSTEASADQTPSGNENAASELRTLIDNMDPGAKALEEYLEHATGMPSVTRFMRMVEQELRAKK